MTMLRGLRNLSFEMMHRIPAVCSCLYQQLRRLCPGKGHEDAALGTVIKASSSGCTKNARDCLVLRSPGGGSKTLWICRKDAKRQVRNLQLQKGHMTERAGANMASHRRYEDVASPSLHQVCDVDEDRPGNAGS
ncbi:hypothetical protein JZ751_026015 [Albula glossodonta]|uniref:Uncharacterized protein n=1 Tax=Albula glossodonta TaxID=121402 RepID=A0A8T2MRL1_9TELE|nr:hypothetical protein JZ751_026015 [Albula glossodonta]